MISDLEWIITRPQAKDQFIMECVQKSETRNREGIILIRALGMNNPDDFNTDLWIIKIVLISTNDIVKISLPHALKKTVTPCFLREPRLKRSYLS